MVSEGDFKAAVALYGDGAIYLGLMMWRLKNGEDLQLSRRGLEDVTLVLRSASDLNKAVLALLGKMLPDEAKEN